MKRSIIIVMLLAFVYSCGGVKKTQQALNTGNYLQAINSSVMELAENKTRKNKQSYVVLLEEAYAKYIEFEEQQINFLKKDGNPAHLEEIYKRYSEMRNVQNRIRPLLPLPIYEENREARFSFPNYENELLAVQESLSSYLYENASQILGNATQKWEFRKAYEDFKYLNEINPGYADTRDQMDYAYQNGLDYVKVRMINDSQQIIPERLEADLLNFNTYGLNSLWTAYHTNPLDEIDYDYEMQVAFRDIVISPEQVSERQVIKERQIKDGTQDLIDEEGNVVRDSLGNRIVIDRLRTVRCNYYEFTQQKIAQVVGNVNFVDLRTRQSLNSYPLTSEFQFQHIYANYDGDRRALDNDLVARLGLAAVPFPTDEEMVYNAGEDIKNRIKNILKNQRFQ
ncbi:hypothetical protein [Robiginitalea aurantiaca]|uniref:Uncharacterized protein n=1 Tax=Robiginitalea aurantiaca TaxID=3056915 RepID=A0ABT7WG69_9FLAO|nr:hypothetical protein [Robiginitalea aurantiaca]MDM9631923.1 hypothetical protein [Robiginitalea aurantiaca]